MSILKTAAEVRAAHYRQAIENRDPIALADILLGYDRTEGNEQVADAHHELCEIIRALKMDNAVARQVAERAIAEQNRERMEARKLHEKAEAWDRVFDEIRNCVPGAFHGDGSGLSLAIAAIQSLAKLQRMTETTPPTDQGDS